MAYGALRSSLTRRRLTAPRPRRLCGCGDEAVELRESVRTSLRENVIAVKAAIPSQSVWDYGQAVMTESLEKRNPFSAFLNLPHHAPDLESLGLSDDFGFEFEVFCKGCIG